VLAALAYRVVGGTTRWWQLLPLLGILALVTVLDLRTRIIPDALTLPGLAYALGLGAVVGGVAGLGRAGLGALVSGGIVLLLAVVSRGGVGGGDIKLMAMLGAALGWKSAVIALALSQLAGAIVVLGLWLVQRRRPTGGFPIGAAIALLGSLILIVE